MNMPGRNEPCHCGSGIKYKKCCLAEDQTKGRDSAKALIPVSTLPDSLNHGGRDGLDQCEVVSNEIPATMDPSSVEVLARLLASWEDAAQSAAQLAGPSLGPEDQEKVDDWLDALDAISERTQAEQTERELGHVIRFLNESPHLFRYLRLQDGFIFELEEDLHFEGRRADYLKLLRRLRAEQPEFYSSSFSIFDVNLITEAIRSGNRQEIPDLLSFFIQYPADRLDACLLVVELLAWAGWGSELKWALNSIVNALPPQEREDYPEFIQEWLIQLTVFEALEAGDQFEEVFEKSRPTMMAVGLDEHDAAKRETALRRLLLITSNPPGAAGLDLKAKGSEDFYNDVTWSFTGWLRRTHGLGWSSSWFLARSLSEYWQWRPNGKKPASRFGLNIENLHRYVTDTFHPDDQDEATVVFATLRAFLEFTEYLVVHQYFAKSDAALLKAALPSSYESLVDQRGPFQSAIQICPTYDAFLAWPKPVEVPVSS